jgi:antirestriction protein ArdC
METATLNQPNETKPTFKDVYQQVTNTIIEQLEQGVIPWQQSWNGSTYQLPLSLPANVVTGNRYRGINIVLLWSAAAKNKFETNEWASFKQWAAKNESVKKGEKGNMVVYYDTFEKEHDGEIKKIPFLKASYVFNRCQLKGYEPAPNINPEHLPGLFEAIDPIDIFLENTKAVIETYDGDPCYNFLEDKIKVPYPENFINTALCTATEGFYSTMLHELVHWSGAKHRLDRTKGKKFGDQAYAAEELVAEFGAAFLCAGFGIATVEKGDHAGYIDHWLKVLKENNRCIVSAASEASKAVDYLYNL